MPSSPPRTISARTSRCARWPVGTSGVSSRTTPHNPRAACSSRISTIMSNAGITPTISNSTSRRIVDGVFGSASVTFNRYLTVEASLRQDVSSTLPKGQNSYNYPSINGSLILSDLIPAIKRGPLSYVKLRAANARVGADASPYSLATTFQGQSSEVRKPPALHARRQHRQREPQAGDHAVQRRRLRAWLLGRARHGRRHVVQQGHARSDPEPERVHGVRLRRRDDQRRRSEQPGLRGHRHPHAGAARRVRVEYLIQLLA